MLCGSRFTSDPLLGRTVINLVPMWQMVPNCACDRFGFRILTLSPIAKGLSVGSGVAGLGAGTATSLGAGAGTFLVAAIVNPANLVTSSCCSACRRTNATMISRISSSLFMRFLWDLGSSLLEKNVVIRSKT